MKITSVPRVSVICASYNSRWLSEAVASVLAQTFRAFEVVVVDDASSASARVTCDSFSDDRVRYVANPARLGPAGSHSRGLEEARAPLAAIINHDDLWEPDLLETLLQRLDSEPLAVIAFSDHGVINTNGEVDVRLGNELTDRWGRRGLEAGLHIPFLELALVSKSVPIAQAAIFRRDCLKLPIPRAVGSAYDWYLTYMLARTGAGAVYEPRRLAYWRLHETNLTSERSTAKALERVRLHQLFLQDSRLGRTRARLVRGYLLSLRSLAGVFARQAVGYRRRFALKRMEDSASDRTQ